MDRSTIINELTDIFRKVLGEPTIVLTPQTTAEDVENWNSLNHIIIVVEVERRFGIKFLTGEMEELETVGGLAELIQHRLAKAGRLT